MRLFLKLVILSRENHQTGTVLVPALADEPAHEAHGLGQRHALVAFAVEQEHGDTHVPDVSHWAGLLEYVRSGTPGRPADQSGLRDVVNEKENSQDSIGLTLNSGKSD
jgi:hypothetical protein